MEKREWNVNKIRFTMVPMAGETLEVYSLWSFLFGNTPEKQTVFPKSKLFQTEGTFGEKFFRLDITYGKIELLCYPVSEGRILENSKEEKIENITFTDGYDFMTLGSLEDNVKSFSDIINRWINSDKFTKVSRMSFFVELAQDFEDLETAYDYLNLYLPFQIKSKISKNFLYQLNLPETINNVVYNKISAWKVRSNKDFNKYVCNPVIDINNEVDNPETPLRDNTKNFETLVAKCIKLSREGIKYD